MNNLYIVWEDNHGDIAITDSYEKAIDFLFDDEWIDIPVNTTKEEYRTHLKSLTREEFNEKICDETGCCCIGIQKFPFENGICRIR
jgi:hypothetical protein